MRILSAFFTVLFTFINPVMLMKVMNEMEKFFDNDRQSLPHLQLQPIELVVSFVVSNNLGSRLRTAALILVTLMSFIHIVFTVLSLYGIYSCRPLFMRPLLIDVFLSFMLLLSFVAFSLAIYWVLNTNGTIKDHDALKIYLRNVYVGSAFLLAYVVWLITSWAGYKDTRKMHADFMYWIVEERMSLKSQQHNVSVDNSAQKSDRSSKASKTSKTSSRSVKSERWAHSRPNSVSTSVCSNKRTSLANARLSVPL